jgi:hypothetical protein
LIKKDYNPRLYVKSNWTPPPANNEIEQALSEFEIQYKEIYQNSLHKKHTPNIPFHIIREMKTIVKKKQYYISNTDKNLGVSIMCNKDMIATAIKEHLSDYKTYQEITKEQALTINEKSFRKILTMLVDEPNTLNQFGIDKETVMYFTRHLGTNIVDGIWRIPEDKKIPYFYLLPKVHKTPLKTRPVVSTVSSILGTLSVWVDYQLEKIIHLCPAYTMDSWQILREIKELGIVSANALIYTADATSMYTNINTKHALSCIFKWFLLHNKDMPEDFPTAHVLVALQLIMTENVFQFGNKFFIQKMVRLWVPLVPANMQHSTTHTTKRPN